MAVIFVNIFEGLQRSMNYNMSEIIEHWTFNLVAA